MKLLLVLLPSVILAGQEPFYAHRGGETLLEKIRIDDYHGPGADSHPDVDTNQILGPFMNPFMEMYESMQQNYKARQYAEQVQKQRDENPLTSSKSLFELFERLQQPPTTTTPQPPLIERLLKPYVEPWQKQFGYLSEDMANLLRPTTTTTTTEAPVTEKKSILERTLAAFFPALRKNKIAAPVPTTTPSWFDPEYLERALFHRDKRHAVHKRQISLFSTDPKPDELGKLPELTNPFTPNPLMAMFTMKPLPDLKELKVDAKPVHDPSTLPLLQPKFKLQDPFYNPLFPNRKSKFFDLLAGGEAARLLG